MKRSDGVEIGIIGVTGGMGVGKSTVTKILSEFGVVICDCDKISRELTDSEEVLDKLADIFGSEILDENGRLRRKFLADIVFSDKEKLNILNSIMHYLIEEAVIEKIDTLKSGDLCVIDAAIPLEKGFIEVCDEIWVVTAQQERRIEHISNRDKLCHDDIKKRIASQLTEEDYLELADVIIVNNFEYDELRKNVIGRFNEFKASRGQ